MTEKKNTLRTLFLTFLKIGAFTFGGGYVMIPLIQREISEKRNWITDEDILDIIAIAESTPGPIAINSATFVGYKVKGFWGAFVATTGIVLPSFVIIALISLVLQEFQSIKAVQFAFSGIRAGVLALIIKALYSMYTKCPKNIFSYLVAAGAFLSVVFFDVSTLLVIIAAALCGLVFSFVNTKEGHK